MPTRNHAYLLPSLLTLGNLLSGFLAIVVLSGAGVENPALTAAGLILLAALLDGFDGLAARRLGVASEFGGRLDSLADVVSFGAAPALLVCELSRPAGRLAWGAAAWLLSATALRLARYDASGDPPGRFEGLPCPAAGATIAAAVIALAGTKGGSQPYLLPALALGLGVLMVSQIAYPRLRVTSRPREFGFVAAVLLTVAVGVSLGGYAPLVICVLFIGSPLYPTSVPDWRLQRRSLGRLLFSRRRDG
ncbi:CDP-diacylglycerol--glycerol-3-phosphate 3-phosphatidyltransferase [Posidoniimonas polymericola]|uniref:CDP-diacylglycerol--glycerol-3-phosphate 3-phosphatidyltransferase n=1 Tax=Posidoniimonas polymericola TaxID=2528002 RepID=A0A5C5XW83_9BACT|nr:CDP-alcohol phosphatidyltransferase family protein [Posidoniimonas polymericola]TWT66791.1 CDP-diacylglycerol--glycerol-3-phosphate 3-phosphatidyltransferase [Posidoniimonas polymericola]